MANQKPVVMGYLGHNPKKLGGAYTYSTEPWKKLRNQMYQTAVNEINRGNLIDCRANLSQGVDLLWALVATDLKKAYPDRVDVSLFGASPNMAAKWTGDMLAVYKHVTNLPDVKTYFTHDEYTSDAVKSTRQQVATMLESAHFVWDGTDSTMGQLVDLASRNNAQVNTIPPTAFGFEVKKDARTQYRNQQPKSGKGRGKNNRYKQNTYGNMDSPFQTPPSQFGQSYPNPQFGMPSYQVGQGYPDQQFNVPPGQFQQGYANYQFPPQPQHDQFGQGYPNYQFQTPHGQFGQAYNPQFHQQMDQFGQGYPNYQFQTPPSQFGQTYPNPQFGMPSYPIGQGYPDQQFNVPPGQFQQGYVAQFPPQQGQGHPNSQFSALNGTENQAPINSSIPQFEYSNNNMNISQEQAAETQRQLDDKWNASAERQKQAQQPQVPSNYRSAQATPNIAAQPKMEQKSPFAVPISSVGSVKQYQELEDKGMMRADDGEFEADLKPKTEPFRDNNGKSLPTQYGLDGVPVETRAVIAEDPMQPFPDEKANRAYWLAYRHGEVYPTYGDMLQSGSSSPVEFSTPYNHGVGDDYENLIASEPASATQSQSSMSQVDLDPNF